MNLRLIPTVALLHEKPLTRTCARIRTCILLFAVALPCPGLPLGPDFARAQGEAELAEPEPTDEPRPQIRVRGEVVETGCFIIGGRKGPDHEQCAIACARAGQDLGVLDEKTKQLYIAVVDRRSGASENPLMPFIAHRVEVRGEPLEYGELPALIVSDVRSLSGPR